MCRFRSRRLWRTRQCPRNARYARLRWFFAENNMALKTYGTMAVDWEQRIDFDRLRKERLARAKALLEKSEMGALLCFDMNNVRYLTSTHIGSWAQDKAN